MKNKINHFKTAFFLLLIITLRSQAQQSEPENLKVFNNWIEWRNGENMLQLYLNQQAFKLLDERENEISGLKTETDWKNRQQKVKRILSEIAGQFPEKTPLNSQITAIIQKDNFRVEKIVYESVPGFRVTGCLFIPLAGSGKKPAVLNVIGHTQESFRRDIYQNIILNLVNKGFIVFAIDPVGQGERMQYADAPPGQVNISGSTQEHSFIANQCLLAGYSLSKYFIWDGVRGIDYLLTRKEVDPERIGLTGLSGGGTQTAFIAAFDDRVKASAPTCYITSYRRLLESIGPQDGEQNFYHGLLNGIDHADLLEARAPKPGLIVSTTRDFFSIQGARETYREVKKAYGAFGMDDNISMSEGDLGHGFIKNNNEATYAFFQKELNLPGDKTELKVDFLSGEELKITPTGQLLTSYGGKTVFDLNKAEVEKLVKKLEVSRKTDPHHLEIVKEKAKELSGYFSPIDEPMPVFRGRYRRDGYVVEMYALEVGRNFVIPLLVMRRGESSSKVILYIHPEGKEAEAKPGGQMEAFVRQGFTVVAPDLPGIGELRANLSFPGASGYLAQLTGRSIVGIQACEIARVVSFVKHSLRINSSSINAVTFGDLCPALLHAAVFEPSISSVALVDSPVSYARIATTRFYKYSLSFSWGVAGALTAYDLPDLAGCLAPRRLHYINLLDATKEKAPEELINDQMSFPKAIFNKAAPGRLKFTKMTEESLPDILTDWFNSE